MASRTELAFARAARRLLPDGSSGLVAVSGGGDSVALVHLLVRHAPRRGWRLRVAHLDHGLRRGSRGDRRFVEALAAGLGLPCTADRREVPALRRRDESPEEAARRVRQAFLREAARETGSDWIGLGHTLDDQAETILMRLARGAGPRALAGMAERGPGRLVRPLLALERAELRTWLGRHGLDWREDPANRSLCFDRNRVRRLALPALAGAVNPRAARNLVRSVARLREDAAHLDELAGAALEGLIVHGGGRGEPLTLDAGRLVGLPAPVGARVARLALIRAGADPRRVGARHLAAVLDLARGGTGRRADLPGGLGAGKRRGGRLVIGPRHPV